MFTSTPSATSTVEIVAWESQLCETSEPTLGEVHFSFNLARSYGTMKLFPDVCGFCFDSACCPRHTLTQIMINNEHTHEREPTRLQVHTTHLIPQHHIARDQPLCPGPRVLALLLLDLRRLLYTDCLGPCTFLCTFLAGRSEVAAARIHGVARHFRIVDGRGSGTVFSAPLLLWLAFTWHRRRVKESSATARCSGGAANENGRIIRRLVQQCQLSMYSLVQKWFSVLSGEKRSIGPIPHVARGPAMGDRRRFQDFLRKQEAATAYKRALADASDSLKKFGSLPVAVRPRPHSALVSKTVPRLVRTRFAYRPRPQYALVHAKQQCRGWRELAVPLRPKCACACACT